jgi:hypothetical protein
MGPIATIVCLAVIWLLFKQEFRDQSLERISWAPFAWLFFALSRFPSAWLQLRTPGVSGVDAYAEGSPLDRTVFLSIIVWGCAVLYSRRLAWAKVFSQNKWILAYLAFCLLSIAWTDQPDLLIKRWLKDLGNPIIALVLLTELRPYDSLITTIRRLAYFLMPVSLLFIRYYPQYGRGYTYGGAPVYSGAADQKNTLGLLCLLTALSYAWRYLFRQKAVDRYDLAMMWMAGYLLYMANSKTSLSCLAIAVIMLAWAARPSMLRRPRRILTGTVLAALAYAALNPLLNLREAGFSALGRDATLTNRTELWNVVGALQTNQWLGTGFMSFWAGSRMRTVWKALGPGINQAHNGYLEQYLNLGYLGVAFIIAIATSSVWSIRRQLPIDYPVAVLKLCIIVAALTYNYTEASFYGINAMWLALLFGCLDAHDVRAPANALTNILHSRQRYSSRGGVQARPYRTPARHDEAIVT